MPFLDDVLKVPSYGWKDEQGVVVKPSVSQLFSEYFSRINIFKSRKNWLSFSDFSISLFFNICFFVFVAKFLSWLTFLIFIVGLFASCLHQTIWHHRYCTHKAYSFSNSFWCFITRNLTMRVLAEEIYVISHHVHHSKSDHPGDPYNAECGFLYCFLATVNHQSIAINMNEESYNKVAKLMDHVGVRGNTYTEYISWGTYANPVRTLVPWLFNWFFWSVVFYFLGGAAAMVTWWGAVGFSWFWIRAFNYLGHAQGKNWQHDGEDFNKEDKSINQVSFGFIAGEWHNNHHLFPTSARSGFKPGQIDMAWYYIKFLSMIGAVSSYRDSKKQFYEKYYIPYLKSKSVKTENAITGI